MTQIPGSLFSVSSWANYLAFLGFSFLYVNCDHATVPFLVYIKNKQSWMLTTVVRIDFSHNNYYIRAEESPVWAELNSHQNRSPENFFMIGSTRKGPCCCYKVAKSFGCVGLCAPLLYTKLLVDSKNLGSALKALCTGYLQGLQHLVRTFNTSMVAQSSVCLFFLNVFM